MTFDAARGARRGLTLLEMIIAIALMILLLAALLTFYAQVGDVRRQAGERVHRTQIARQVVGRIADELRGCIGFDRIGFPVEQRLIGDRRSIQFLTSRLPDRDRYEMRRESEVIPPAEHDLLMVGYRLWVDPENTDPNGEPIVGGIIRTEKRTLNQFLIDEEDPLVVRNDLWSAELGYLEFRYFDGSEWDTKWDLTEGNSLPQLIQVTVGFSNVTQEELDNLDLQRYPLAEYPFGDDQPHADRYSVIVRLPAADKFYGSRFQRVGKQLAEQLGVGGDVVP